MNHSLNSLPPARRSEASRALGTSARHSFLCSSLVVVAFTACGADGSGADRGSPQESGADSPNEDEQGALRCGDFMSAAEADAIGIDGYDEGASQSDPNRGVHCALQGSVALTIFHGSNYGSIVGGLEHAKLPLEEGPAVGSKSQWYVSSGQPAVTFLSDNGRYAANMSTKDRATLESIAVKLAPYLDKP